jgi:hypothetical protein
VIFDNRSLHPDFVFGENAGENGEKKKHLTP